MPEPLREPLSSRVRVGDVELAYDVRGAGEPLLLLPGFSMRRIMWPEALCDALARAGLEVVRMDNRDAGDSARIDAPPPRVPVAMGRSLLGLPVRVPYRLEDMAEDAFGLMRALGHERFHVAGASMGGMIAQTMAIVRPERLRSLTSVMSSPGGRRYSFGRPQALKALLTPLPREREAQIERLVEVFRLLHGDQLPFDEAEARALATAQVSGGTSPSAAARQLGAIFESAMRRLPRLRRVRTPTLVIHGTEDPLLPLRGAEAMARLLPRAELLRVRGMGHGFPAQVVPQVADAIATHAKRAVAPGPRPAAREPIKVRRMDFQLGPDIPENWGRDNATLTALMAALSASFPAGERFFIESVRHYADRIDDPELKERIRGFIGQEANHTKEHLAFNRFLDGRGLPVAAIERRVEAVIADLKRRHSPAQNLAHTVALEHLTAVMASALLETPDALTQVHPTVAAFWAWHAIEEIEHRSVAFEVYQQCVGDERMRVVTMAVVTFMFSLVNAVRTVELLRHTGQLFRPADWLRGFALLFGPNGLFRKVGPLYWSYYRRDFHPDQHDNRALVDRARAHYL